MYNDLLSQCSRNGSGSLEVELLVSKQAEQTKTMWAF